MAFDAVYNSATEAERKELMKAFIERIDLYPEKRKDGCWIRSIVFNFPMPVEGGEVKELSLESETTVETVCLLVLRNPVTHINIDVDVEEMVQDKRGLATYGQIKDYVLEHSGLNVSSLYIAQVKQKHGIIERENYNKPKSEDARQPQCPLETERAITEALKHFGML